MSYANGPKIVTDGLALYLDAGNSKSYPGSGNVWYDLSANNNNGTLTNGAVYDTEGGGSIYFDKVNDKVVSTNSSSVQITTGTIGAFFKATNQNTGVHGIIAKQSAWGLFVWGNILRTYSWGTPAVRSTSYTVGDNKWHYAAMTFTETIGNPSNNAIIYLDGNAILTTTIKHSNHNVTVQVGEANANQFFGGNIAQASVYNKVLTHDEIQQNYNALKGRFGLS